MYKIRSVTEIPGSLSQSVFYATDLSIFDNILNLNAVHQITTL